MGLSSSQYRLQSGHSGLYSDTLFCIAILAGCLVYNLLTLTAYLASISPEYLDTAGRVVGRDFVNYWTGGVAVFDGMIPEIFDIQLYHPYQEQLLGLEFVEHNWSYPPHMLLLVSPLGLMPYLPALALWSAFMLGGYIWVCSAQNVDRLAIAGALLLAPASFVCLTTGQNGFLTAVLLIGGIRLLGKHSILAGVLFGILTVKPQLGILVPFALVAAREWKAIISASLTAVTLIGLSVVFFGIESWKSYFELVVPVQSSIVNEGRGVFLTMMPSAYVGLRLLGFDQDVRAIVQVFLLIVAVIGVAWTFARSQDWVLRLAVLAVGTIVASPYAFNYDMTAVSLAVALLALRALRQSFLPGERIVLALTWLLPITVELLNPIGLPIGSLVLLACFGLVLWRVYEERFGLEGGSKTAIERGA